ncbi:zinc-dependent alcohol dehydrogenase family protein [Salarchaeum japonicum]|uniref:zinc-dependent alcohol dehydrogenase family protein n=1 Tax=Salarchaeum japonicum TaxID=555573 RepID=UPI003C7258C8
MRAAVLRAYGEPLSIEERDRPSAAPHGVVVEVEACGVCRSDWHAWKGHGEWADDDVPLGQVLGHEPAGRVVEVGERVSEFAVGDDVAVPFCLGDGSCPRCLSGHGNRCEDGYALGFEPAVPGAFAEYVAVPHADYNATHRPESVSARAAAALGCRFMTAFHALAHRAPLAPGDWVAVHGCGGVGLSAVQVADALGARVVAVDVREEALDAAARMGAAETVNADESDVPAEIRRRVGGAHVSLDALGSAETCRASVESLRSGGTHVQLGLTTDAEKGEVSLPTDYMTRHELSFLGSRGMSPTSYDELFSLIDADKVDPDALVTRELSLDEVPARLAAMDDYGTNGVEVVTEF